MVFWRRFPRKGTEKKSFLANFAQFAARVLGSLAVIALLLILIDQMRHILSDSEATESYANVQREKYAFACYQHSRAIALPEEKIITDAGNIEREQIRTELAVYQLMDEARQQIAPADFWGKLRLFSLCSNFSKVGFSGFEVAGNALQTVSVMRIQPEDVDEIYEKTTRWEAQFPTIADSTLAELRCELIRLKDIAANMNVICVDQRRLIKPERVGTLHKLEICELVGNPQVCAVPTQGVPCACEPSDGGVVISSKTEWKLQWLLVTGADQSYADTKAQVESVKAVLEARGYDLDATPVEVRKIRSWKRTVVVFPDQDTARNALTDLLTALPYGGYVRNQQSWCPDYNPEGTPLDISQDLALEGINSIGSVVRQCVKSQDE